MSQNPLIDANGTQSSKTSGLNSALATALASLEVQLDQELARYRRTRIGTRTPSQPRMGNYISAQHQELTDTSVTVGKTQPAVAEINLDAPFTISDEITPEKLASPTVNSEVDRLEVSSNLESSRTQIPLPLPNSTSSIVPAAVPATPNENLPQKDHPTQPDDYLESSEALLRSLTDEQPQTKKPSNSSDSLLSPLGIGSILLLLLASLTLGYVVFNPKGLPQLNLSKLFNGNSSANTQNTNEGIENNVQPQAQPEITSIAKYPNLAAKEFPEVKDLNDVVGLKPKLQLTPQALPNPVVAQTPILPLPINPLPPVQPLPPVDLPPISKVQPSPQVTTTPPKTNTQITPAADGFYHLVTDNQSDRSLAAARKVVPDAYLSRSQKLIYLGSLKTKGEAQQRLKQLQAQGIKARVDQP